MNMKKAASWELKNTKKALSGPLASFLNTEEDKARLKKVEEELKRRSDKYEE